jgi:hypothetical protein
LWWLTGTNNWNAVCLANTAGAAVTAIPLPDRRAFYVASAEKYVQNFLKGFTPNGYCSEGMGYWNYGFGHYVMLAETLHRQTGGRVDLMSDPRVKEIAQFGRRMEITPGVYPAFADCSPVARPARWLTVVLSRRFDFGWNDGRGPVVDVGEARYLSTFGLFGFTDSLGKWPIVNTTPPEQPLRNWFPDAGTLICRSAPGATPPLGVALKGGHNDEHHNHNDVGSYVVALGKRTPLVDPGRETYTQRTFSSRRYESGVLNSWGHPVPRVAGKLQKTGRQAAARVLKTEFTDRTDTLVLDLRSAYDVKELKRLVRTFIYSRVGVGGLRVIDEVEFDGPTRFETTLITFDTWQRLGPNRLCIGQADAAVDVTIDTGGAPFAVRAEEIKEDLRGHGRPTRLGIELSDPVHNATVTLTIRAIR